MKHLKKLILVSCLALIGVTAAPLSSSAQSTEMTKEQKAELKATQQLQKAKIDLGKKLEKLIKEKAKLEKMRTKFERDNAAGRLSPNDVEKTTKKINGRVKSIERLEKDIEKLETYIKENEDGF
jgi:Ni/Co efflux regulator RcnB